MQGYWPTTAEETIEQQLKNVQDAINIRDDSYVFQTLNTQPSLTPHHGTLYMFAQRNGCSDQVREFLKRKTEENAAKVEDDAPKSSAAVIKY